MGRNSKEKEDNNKEVTTLEGQIEILLARTEHISSINKTVTNIETRLDNLENYLKSEIKRVDDRIDAIEKSQTFISKEHEKQTTVSNNIITKNSDLTKQNEELKKQLDSIVHDLEQEKAGRNEENQYHRASLNAKIVGIPYQKGEEVRAETSNSTTTDVIKKLANVANIEFDINDIDVCHRVSKVRYSPIIIRFKSKTAKCSFFKQRYSLRDKAIEDFDFYGEKELYPDKDGRKKKSETKKPYIQILEHLTAMNGSLLAETRSYLAENADVEWAYPGYVGPGGQIRAKKEQSQEKPYIIRCKSDIYKLVKRERAPPDA